ncbi:hypothetical protein [Serpentinicella alkaliphila]|uniref:Uncharacterized protein n=1 Tax=Serpentinicella alkaliphila TaxID=1734049 RepID=A0A4R2SY27_9FIRM|nr:hypothetical protein [Serpentinicella alkaliphila]QUH26954.1 hypothetical protein HZR23_15295 [Serpentinicella alkaliphila]TCP95407.1 hypothetical protein EDD79_10609 [Serpentinicella alkaliphila]
MYNKIEKNNDSDILNILVLGFFLYLFLSRDKSKLNITKKLSFKEIDTDSIDKKAKLLNRIKGYMDTDEQKIIHRAEIILQLIGNAKLLFQTDEIVNANIRNSSLTLDDRKRNMLIDLSEFIDDEKRDVIHQAIDMDVQVKKFTNKLKDLQTINSQGTGLTMDHIEKYIDVIEPFLDKEISTKISEGKKLLSMLKLYKSIEEKGTINEIDIIEMLKPYIAEEQRENLSRMVNIMKVVSSISMDDKPKENEQLIESQPKPEDKKDDSINIISS